MAASEGDGTCLFMSTDTRFPLIDMIYREGDVYYAFKATKANKEKDLADTFATLMEKLVRKLRLEEDKRSLKVYYASSKDSFGKFVTSPFEPVVDSDRVELFHLHLVKNLNAPA